MIGEGKFTPWTFNDMPAISTLNESRSTPPVEVSSDADVIAFVRSRPGAIGYVSPQTDVKSVKVLNIID